MYCSICKDRETHLNYSTPGYGVGVCKYCYGEFNNMMNMMNKNCSEITLYTTANWGTSSATRWNGEADVKVERLKVEMERGKEKEVRQVKEEMKKRDEWWIDYFGGLSSAFSEESYSDIQVKPGNGPSIPAHKFLLVSICTTLSGFLTFVCYLLWGIWIGRNDLLYKNTNMTPAQTGR